MCLLFCCSVDWVLAERNVLDDDDVVDAFDDLKTNLRFFVALRAYFRQGVSSSSRRSSSSSK